MQTCLKASKLEPGKDKGWSHKKCKMGSWPPLRLSLSMQICLNNVLSALKKTRPVVPSPSPFRHTPCAASVDLLWLFAHVHPWNHQKLLHLGALTKKLLPVRGTSASRNWIFHGNWIPENNAQFYTYSISLPTPPSMQTSPSLAHPLQGAWTTPHCRSALLYPCILWSASSLSTSAGPRWNHPSHVFSFLVPPLSLVSSFV